MALRFSFQFYSEYGLENEIRIHDDNYVGIVHQFTTVRGAKLKTEGDSKMIGNPIAPTTLSFSALVNTDAMIAFVDNPKTVDTDYKVQLYRDGSLYFVGYLVLRGFKIQDDKKNRVAHFVATCGLNRLKDIPLDYNTLFSDPWPDHVSFFETIKCIFTQGKILELYNGGDFMRMRMIYLEDGATGQVIHPLKIYKHNPFAFADERRVFVSCLTALQGIMNSFNSRLFHREGMFCMENRWTPKFQGGAYWRIQEDGTDTFSIEDYDIVVDYDVNRIKPIPGNTNTSLTPPKVISLTFEGGGSNNIAKAVRFENSNIGTTFRLGYVFAGDKIFKFQLIVRRETQPPYTTQYAQTYLNWVRYEFKIKIGNRYLTGSEVSQNFNFLTVDPAIVNQGLSWTLTPDETFFLYSDANLLIYDAFELIEKIPAILEPGIIEITLVDADYVHLGTLEPLDIPDNEFNFVSQDLVILANQKADESNVVYNKVVDPEGYEILKYTMQLGDVAEFYDSEQSIFYTDSGGTLHLSEEWNGSGKKLQEIILNEIVDMRSSIINLYNGTFIDLNPTVNKMHQTNRLIHRNKAYNFLQTEYNLTDDEISGTWYEILNANISGGTPPTLPDYPVVSPEEEKTYELHVVPLGGAKAANVTSIQIEHPEITTLGAALTAGGSPITSIGVNSTTSELYAGDQILLIDVNLRKKEVLTVATDTAIGATSINIEPHTMTFDWPSGTDLTVDPKFVSQNALTFNNMIEEFHENVSGKRITLAYDLTAIAAMSTDEIRKRIKGMSDNFYYYNPSQKKRNQFILDVAGSNNDLVFKENLRGLDILIQIFKIPN